MMKKMNLTKEKLILILLAGLLIVFILLPTNNTVAASKKSNGENIQTSSEDKFDFAMNYITHLEEELESVLSKVEKVGNVDVMITLDDYGISDVKSDVKITEKTTEEKVVLIKSSNGETKPYVITQSVPQIMGVIVVAQGADDAKTTSEITKAVMAVLGIGANKIMILKMEE